MKNAAVFRSTRTIFFSLFAITLFLSGASTWAIDQLILNSGEIIEGKILSEVPNRHVDIQLVNGQKRRYPRSQVSGVERDVPSNLDSSMLGVNRRIFVGPQLGGLLNLEGGELAFVFGAKIGYHAANLGESFFSPTLSYRLYTESSGLASAALHFINTQFLFKKIGSSGFYVGPQVGLLIGSGDFAGVTGSGSSFLAGAGLGYDIQLSDSFSIGPDVQFDYSFSGKSSLISFGLVASFHFE